MYVIDSGKIYSTDTAIGSLSDARHKENIRDLDVGLDAITQLKPRRFDWKANKGTGKKDVAGFIAQEVEPIFPDLIDAWKDAETPDLKALSMGGMVPAIARILMQMLLLIKFSLAETGMTQPINTTECQKNKLKQCGIKTATKHQGQEHKCIMTLNVIGTKCLFQILASNSNGF